METYPTPPSRPWKDVARELAGQTDFKKIAELSAELNKALAEQKGPLAAE